VKRIKGTVSNSRWNLRKNRAEESAERKMKQVLRQSGKKRGGE